MKSVKVHKVLLKEKEKGQHHLQMVNTRKEKCLNNNLNL